MQEVLHRQSESSSKLMQEGNDFCNSAPADDLIHDLEMISLEYLNIWSSSTYAKFEAQTFDVGFPQSNIWH